MKLRLDGHRLTAPEIAALIVELGWIGMDARFREDGFSLRPIRAPKRMRNGRLNFRLCWVRKDGAVTETIRMSATV
jgi:hypothetical protein